MVAAAPKEKELLGVDDPNNPPPLLDAGVAAAGAAGCPKPDPAPNDDWLKEKPLAEPEVAGWPKPAAGLCPNAGLPKPEVLELPKDPNAEGGAEEGG